MKKGIIGIIILIALGGTYLGVTQYQNWTNNGQVKKVTTLTSNTNTNTNSTNSDSSTDSKVKAQTDNDKSNNEKTDKNAGVQKTKVTSHENSNDNTKSTSDTSSVTDNTVATSDSKISDQGNISSNNSNNSNKQVSTKANVFELQNQNNLSMLANNYLQEFKNLSEKTTAMLNNPNQDQQQLDRTAANAYVLWNNELNKLYGDITKNLTTSEATQLQVQENLWINFKNESVSSLAGQGSIVPLLQADRALYLTQERCYYLFLYYLNNNSSFPSEELNPSLTANNSTGSFVSEFQSDLDQASVNYATSSADTNEAMLSDYNQLYSIFNTDLNNLYSGIMSKIQGSDYETQGVQSAEEQWVTYKENAVDLAGQEYTNSTESKIAEQKTNLALTQARYFYLLNDNGYLLN